ncbi:MAG: DUF3772 domain-containing protein [Pseudomonadota bacterium]
MSMPTLRRVFAWVCVALTLFLALPAVAQETPDYGAWDVVANRAERAVANARASDDAFRDLRTEIEAFRSIFADAQAINAPRLATLRAQLAALGPAPEEGQEEAPGVAERRTALAGQITDLAAPGLRAEEAFTRADGIIGEIDAILRERRAAALTARGPTLIDDTVWRDFPRDLNGTVVEAYDGIARSFANGTAGQSLRQNLPVIAILLAIAVVFVVRARRWLEMLVERVENLGSGAALRLSGFVISLAQIAIPVLGLAALSRALLLTGLFGFWGEALIAFLPAFGLSIFLARWLAGRLFPASAVVQSPLTVPRSRYRAAKWGVVTTGIVVGLAGMAGTLSEMDGYSAATRVGLELPLIVLAGYLLFRIGRLLSLHEPAVSAEGEKQPTVVDRLVKLLSRLARLIGWVGPLAGILGYLNAAEALVYPAIASLALFAILAILIDVIRDIYLVVGRAASADESLVPVLGAVALFVASGPIFALIWGASVTDLAEMWQTIVAGVTIGETTISPGALLLLIVIFALGFTVTRFVQAALRTAVLPKTKLDIGGQTAVVSGVGYIGIFLAALIAISSAGINLSSVAIVAGALSVGIGFGLQNIVSNFISGIILLVERPISEGDWIAVGGNMGYVRDISVRSTRIETFDRTDVIIPNADLISGTVTNYTRGNSVGRVIVPVGVAYGTDTRLVERILREIAEANPMVTLKPPPAIVFMGFGADSLDFEIRAILRDVNWVLSVKSDMNHAIAERFAEAGIEIPFAQRDIWLRNPEEIKKIAVHDMERDDAGDPAEDESGEGGAGG